VQTHRPAYGIPGTKIPKNPDPVSIMIRWPPLSAGDSGPANTGALPWVPIDTILLIRMPPIWPPPAPDPADFVSDGRMPVVPARPFQAQTHETPFRESAGVGTAVKPTRGYRTLPPGLNRLCRNYGRFGRPSLSHPISVSIDRTP